MTTDDRSPERPFRIYGATSFGEALRHYREEAGLSQGELATRVGVSRQYVNQLENGEGTERLERLLRAFHELGVRAKLGYEDW